LLNIARLRTHDELNQVAKFVFPWSYWKYFRTKCISLM
jgi:hypothetical protein